HVVMFLDPAAGGELPDHGLVELAAGRVVDGFEARLRELQPRLSFAKTGSGSLDGRPCCRTGSRRGQLVREPSGCQRCPPDEILGGTEDGRKEERKRGTIGGEPGEGKTGRCWTTLRVGRSGDAGHQLREPG